MSFSEMDASWLPREALERQVRLLKQQVEAFQGRERARELLGSDGAAAAGPFHAFLGSEADLPADLQQLHQKVAQLTDQLNQERTLRAEAEARSETASKEAETSARHAQEANEALKLATEKISSLSIANSSLRLKLDSAGKDFNRLNEELHEAKVAIAGYELRVHQRTLDQVQSRSERSESRSGSCASEGTAGSGGRASSGGRAPSSSTSSTGASSSASSTGASSSASASSPSSIKCYYVNYGKVSAAKRQRWSDDGIATIENTRVVLYDLRGFQLASSRLDSRSELRRILYGDQIFRLSSWLQCRLLDEFPAEEYHNRTCFETEAKEPAEPAPPAKRCPVRPTYSALSRR